MIFGYNCLTQGQKMLVTRTFVLHLIRSERERKQSISLIAIYSHKLLLRSIWLQATRTSNALSAIELRFHEFRTCHQVITGILIYLLFDLTTATQAAAMLFQNGTMYIIIWLFGAQQHNPDEWKKCRSFDLDGTCNNYVYGIIYE